MVTVASQSGHLKIMKSEERKSIFTDPNLQLEELESLMQAFLNDVESGVHESMGWPNSNYGMSKLGVIALTKVINNSLDISLNIYNNDTSNIVCDILTLMILYLYF